MAPCTLGPVPHDEIGWWTAFSTYFGYAVLIIFGYLRDYIHRWTYGSVHQAEPGYAPIIKDFEDFYTRRMYTRIRDAFHRPICSTPDAYIDILEETSDDYNVTQRLTGKKIHCLNLGSYNYLGFGGISSPCVTDVVKTFDRFPVSTCSARSDFGTTTLHIELEELVARFIRKPAALVFGMGYGTNSTVLPAILQKGDLVISDSFNHASIIVGVRLSQAKIKVFPHGNHKQLERIVRSAIVSGQPRTHRPWNKIMVVVEGIYSMEGEICRLPEIVEIVKKYKCYLYVDEAHSIGALGESGRGVCEYTGVDPADVDILMGTFTKSFGAVGGYIAGSKELIAQLRNTCSGISESPGLAPACCQQVISSMKIISGEDGTDLGEKRLKSLRDNSNFFRQGMMDIGVQVLGDWDSPVVPVMLCNPAKISAFSRECLKRNVVSLRAESERLPLNRAVAQIAVVVVGFPATPLLLSRVRFCISAAHTRVDLENALVKLDEVCSLVHVKYKKYIMG